MGTRRVQENQNCGKEKSKLGCNDVLKPYVPVSVSERHHTERANGLLLRQGKRKVENLQGMDYHRSSRIRTDCESVAVEKNRAAGKVRQRGVKGDGGSCSASLNGFGRE